MGRQSDQVERVACGSGKSINFYQSEGCRECCGFENNKMVITEIDS